MFRQLFTAAWLWFLVFGLAAGDLGDRSAAGHFSRRTLMSDMSGKKDVPVFLERVTEAVMFPVDVPLNEFLLKPELYCHRDEGELDEKSLQPLMDSLVIEGLHTAVEFFRDSEGRPVPIRGHRRITAMRILAERNTPRFTATMPVQAIEVRKATPQDLLCRSVSDNTNRKGYSLVARIRIAKQLHDAGVEVNRAAYAMNYSSKQYLRDLKIAKCDWMFDLVTADNVAHTQAAELLDAAEKAGRMEDLKSHLTNWIEGKKTEIRQKATVLRPYGVPQKFCYTL